MSKTMYSLNPDLYRKNGTRRPGAICNKVLPKIPNEDISKKDRENREIVTKTMIKYVEKGVEPENAAIMIAHTTKVKAAFEYLTNAGIDLKKLFLDFYNREANKGNEDKDVVR